jgi:hypothetical protein
VLSKETCLQDTEKDNWKMGSSSSLIKEDILKASAVLGRKKVVSKFKEEVSGDFGKPPRLI